MESTMAQAETATTLMPCGDRRASKRSERTARARRRRYARMAPYAEGRRRARRFRANGPRCKAVAVAGVGRGNSRTMVVECLLCNSTGVKWGFVWVWSLSIGKHPRRRVLTGA